jgi:hypothetical protein
MIMIMRLAKGIRSSGGALLFPFRGQKCNQGGVYPDPRLKTRSGCPHAEISSLICFPV